MGAFVHSSLLSRALQEQKAQEEALPNSFRLGAERIRCVAKADRVRPMTEDDREDLLEGLKAKWEQARFFFF